MPTTTIDSIMDYPNVYSTNGKTLNSANADFMHGAVVKRDTGAPQISVDPVFLDFYKAVSKSDKSCDEPGRVIPKLSENDPKYWESAVLGKVVIGYRDNVNVNEASLKELGIDQKGVTLTYRMLPSTVNNIPSLNFIVVEVTPDINTMKSFIQQMAKNPDVKYAEPVHEVHAFATPNDTYFSSFQWDKTDLNCPAAWDYGWGKRYYGKRYYICSNYR